jgi:UDP-N-acetylmuramate dehydrogenase
MGVAMRKNIALAAYTTFHTGGPAAYLWTVHTIAELETAVLFAQANKLPFFVLGGGSNVLVSDAGYSGVVIKMEITGRVYTEPDVTGVVRATVAAGEILDDVIAEMVKDGLWGLENLSHIPGTVGATPIQNVGAYGVEVSDCIQAVTVYDCIQHTVRELSVAECMFSYRDSVFKHQAGAAWIVTAVTFNVSTTPNPKVTYADIARVLGSRVATLAEIRSTIIDIRSKKFPDWRYVGTAGSFFKNPIMSEINASRLQKEYPALPVYPVRPGYAKVSLGYVLDKICGLKGYTSGNVGLYEAQALVLVAHDGATTTEILKFADTIAKLVFEKTHIEIECEVTKIL